MKLYKRENKNGQRILAMAKRNVTGTGTLLKYVFTRDSN